MEGRILPAGLVFASCVLNARPHPPTQVLDAPVYTVMLQMRQFQIFQTDAVTSRTAIILVPVRLPSYDGSVIFYWADPPQLVSPLPC